MIEIYLLEQLVAFAKNGTLLKAAQELHITQPALSRSMKKLEEEFGVSLFHREKSRISLNETGKVAAQYAQKVLEADEDMIERVLFFDRSQRTISVGTCTPFPMWELMPTLQNYLSDMAITSEMTDDKKLLDGLKKNFYQLVIMHQKPEGKDYYAQRYLEEQLYITMDQNHPLANNKSLSFDDLRDYTILVNGNTGFWLKICESHLSDKKLLVQKDIDALGALVENTSLPFFNADSMIKRDYELENHISIPIRDPDAHAIYYIVCLSSNKKRYANIFSSARATVLNT